MRPVNAALAIAVLLLVKSSKHVVNIVASESTSAISVRPDEDIKIGPATQDASYQPSYGSYCNPDCRRGDALLLVSTMDGSLTALDTSNNGQTLWSLETGPKLLSSSLSNLEVVYAGVPTRLVPSLDGNIYKLVQDDAARAAVVEPMPFTADSLLSSSVRLSADATIVGSREATTYGINVNNGKVKYVCDKAGCVNDGSSGAAGSGPGAHVGGGGSATSCLVVVRHSVQTVRTVAIRSGSEKWNFSVGQHEVKFVTEHGGTCDQSCDFPDGCESDGADVISVPSLKFDLSKGIIKAYEGESDNARSCQRPTWSRQLPYAISKAWLLANGTATELDLFDKAMVLQVVDDASSAGDACSSDDGVRGPPLLYVGAFEKQLYVQLSPQLQEHMAAVARQLSYGARSGIGSYSLRVAWKPYMATASSRTPWLNTGANVQYQLVDGHPLCDAASCEQQSGASSPKEGNSLAIYKNVDEYPFDGGYYVYARDKASSASPDYMQYLKNKSPPAKDRATLPLAHDTDEDDSFVDYFGNITYVVIQGSPWHYWKEILAICIVFAVGANFIYYKLRKYRKMIRDRIRSLSGQDGQQLQQQQTDGTAPQPLVATAEAREPLISHVSDCRLVEYTSRYASDFEQVKCLGRGGFGVVFEARNKIDDCSYAIKRISLPDSLDAKERVMREVKALAKLDHPGIVRYFQAWFETPPLDWCYETDAEDLPPSTNIGASVEESPSTTAAATSVPRDGRSVQFTSSGPFVPHLRLASSTETSLLRELDGSLAEPRNVTQQSADDSFDVVFAVGDTSPSADERSGRIPFNKYAEVKNVSASQTSEESGISECRQAEKARCQDKAVAATAAGDDAESSSDEDQASSVSSQSTRSHSKASLPPGHSAQARPRRLFLFIQMQLCKRETLKDYLTANTLNRDRSEMMYIFCQIANAVEYIHEQGLIHRDLKPSNIFFAGADVVKVGDFGLVTPAAEYGDGDGSSSPMMSSAPGDGPRELRRHTDNVGTQLYMSPEQVDGLHYDHKVDIYAMGLVFFELMYPFSTQMERCKSIQDARRLVLPERFQRELPAEGKFVKWLLQHNPEMRPDIHEVLHSKLVQAHTASVARDPRRPRQRTLSKPGD